jgi:molybdopterin/thiamine biosynthesis adenylyltransferase
MKLVGRPGRLYLTHAARLGTPHPALKERYFDGMPEEDGYWVALDPTPSPQVLGNPDELLRVVGDRAPRAFKRLGYRLRNNKALTSAECWIGITFMEEGPTRDETRRNWVFTHITRDRDGRQRSGRLLRAQALTLDERRRRTPELVGLEHARVLVIGAGSLGSPVAVELAKAGIGHLDIVDNDVLDVNNSVRHVLSPRQAGLHKAQGTASVAADLNPFVTVEGHELQVGGSAYAARELAALVEQATVVVDTTGSSAVARILQRHCADVGRIIVVAGLSAGSWGGEVAVFTPGEACFECFVLAQRDGGVPQPHAAPPGPGVTPVGCSHPAFSGAGFDATELAALTARMVVQATEASTYPPLDLDWAVVNFRGAPRWESDRLAKHPECARCNPPEDKPSS